MLGKSKLSKNLKTKNILLCSVTGFVFASGTAPVTFAQDAPDSYTDDEIVVVTARNREENIQDVPLSITAFTDEDFSRRNIETLDDVARLTAGLSFEDFSGGFATPVIRGQTQTRITALESNVSAFLDGIYIPRSWAFDVGTANLNRIEVVKGPQSARYGRNAFAGAINYVPFKATLTDDPLSGQLSGTIGNNERYDAGLRANLSLGERLAVAGSVNYSTFDGTFNNSHPFGGVDLDQGTNGNVGGYDNISFSASAIANPIDPFTVEISYNRFDVENEQRAGQNNNQGAGDLNCGGTVFFSPRLFCGELTATDTVSVDPRSFAVDAQTDIFRVGASYELNDNFDVFYTFGIVDGNVLAAGSSESDQINCGLIPSMTPFCAFTASPVGGIDYTSHELRFVYDDDTTWRFELGGFFSNGEDVFTTFFPNAPIFTGVFDPTTIVSITDSSPFFPVGDPAASDIIDTQQRAVFGALQWSSTDSRLRLGAELRYSETEITTTSAAGDPLNETFGAITPRITAEYSVTDGSLLYATIARGAKAGGFNTNAISPDLQPFDEELNWTYEVGAKNQFFDNRAVFNIAAFYTDWSELQIASVDPLNFSPFATPVTDNLGNARVFGVELEGSFRLTDNFSVDGTFSYTNGRYSEGTFDDRFTQTAPFGLGFETLTSCDGVVCPLDGDISGNEIERTPSTQVSLGAQWEDELPIWNANYYIRTDLSWQNSFFADTVNLAIIEDRFLLGGSAGVVIDNFEVSIWARNITDETFVSNSFVIVAPFGNAFNSFFGDRRSAGITAKVNF